MEHRPPPRRSRRQRLAFGAALVCILLLGLTVALIRGWVWRPPPELVVPVERRGDAPHIGSGTSLSVLVWNLQYCGSRNYHFFYDGGDDVHVTPEHVQQTVEGVAEVLARSDIDLLLLQEVDRRSSRTGGVDQLAELLARCPYPRHASTSYHRVRYVPHPPGQHLGRIDMQLATLTRRETRSARRFQLPLLRESWLRRQFNLRRAILELELSRGEDRPPLVVLNTHLSAFSQGDGTLDEQVDALLQRLADHDAAGSPWLLGGDLNMLPPGDDPVRLGDDAVWYSDDSNPLQRLFDAGHRSAFPVEALTEHPGDLGTYMSPGSARADRTLDYLFVSSGVEVLSARVLSQYSDVSDHLPLKVELRIP